METIIEATKLTNLSSSEDHYSIQYFFQQRGWETEASIFPISSYRIDAYKDRIGVEIERSLIDAIHRILFRTLWSYSKKQVDILVFIVPTFKEPRFENVKRDIKAFENILPYSIFLCGVHR